MVQALTLGKQTTRKATKEESQRAKSIINLTARKKSKKKKRTAKQFIFDLLDPRKVFGKDPKELEKKGIVVKQQIIPLGIGAGSPAVIAGLKSVAKPTATIGTIALLAPETTKKVLGEPALLKTAGAGFVSPIAGVVVGLEQGAGIVGGGIKKIKEGLEDVDIPDAVKTAGLTAAGIAAAIAAGIGVSKAVKGRKTADETISSTPSSVPSSVALPKDKVPTPTASLIKEKPEPVIAEVPTPDKDMPDISIKNIVKPQINVAVATA